jgi:archaetidylinositol phosphate synthase
MLDTILGRINGIKKTQRGLAHLLFRLGLAPDQVTIGGLILGLGAGVAFAAGALGWGIILLLLSAALDALDGTLAREFATPTPLGGIFDISADRVVEAAVLIGIAWNRPELYLPGLVLVASWYVNIAVFMASGAALESGPKLIAYAPGLVERSEAIVFFILLALIRPVGPALCYLYTALELITAIQRLSFARESLKDQRR